MVEQLKSIHFYNSYLRDLRLTQFGYNFSWKYPQLVSSEDWAKHCFKNELTLIESQNFRRTYFQADSYESTRKKFSAFTFFFFLYFYKNRIFLKDDEKLFLHFRN